MLDLIPVATDKAPGAVGAYSQAVVLGDLVFTSGCLPIDPASKTMPESIQEQAALVLSNLEAVLEGAGSSLSRVAKATVFLTDIKDFAAVNDAYSSVFSRPFPARSCVAVAALPLGAKVEIEAVAAKR